LIYKYTIKRTIKGHQF